jgi:hypothetical protein
VIYPNSRVNKNEAKITYPNSTGKSVGLPYLTKTIGFQTTLRQAASLPFCRKQLFRVLPRYAREIPLASSRYLKTFLVFDFGRRVK